MEKRFAVDFQNTTRLQLTNSKLKHEREYKLSS